MSLGVSAGHLVITGPCVYKYCLVLTVAWQENYNCDKPRSHLDQSRHQDWWMGSSLDTQQGHMQDWVLELYLLGK